MFRRLLSPHSVLIMLLTGGVVATGGYAWAQTTTDQPATVFACTFNRVLFLADSTTQKCSIGKRVELVTTAYKDPDIAKLTSRVDALENKAGALELKVSALEDKAGALESKVSALESKAGALESKVSALEATAGALQAKLSKVSFDATGLNGKPTLKIDGANLQIVSGSGATDATVNGLGNLFIGYAENALNRAQTGSHNLVLGTEQSFTSYGGLIGGERNTLSGAYASVLGAGNIASGTGSSVSGGVSNTASGTGSSVSGGALNTASGLDSSVSGGTSNTASGFRSSILGGSFVVVNTTNGTSP